MEPMTDEEYDEYYDYELERYGGTYSSYLGLKEYNEDERNEE